MVRAARQAVLSDGQENPKRVFKTLNVVPAPWHGDWNYAIKPRARSCSVDFRIRGPLESLAQ